MNFPKGTRTQKNKIFMKFFTLHKTMMQRCYNPKCSSYKNYGAKGVTVSKEWQELNNFLDTIDKVEGFELKKILSGELELDKDINSKNKKIYSLKTCMFVNKKINCSNRNNNKEFVAVDPEYNIFYHKNKNQFCKENNLDVRHVFNILKNGKGSHKNWQFFYKENFSESKIKKRQEYIVVFPEGKIQKIDCKISEFAKKYNLCPANLSMVISGKNKHHKKFQIWKAENFEKNKIINFKKNKFIGISPENKVFVFDNITNFANAKNLNQSSISICLSKNKKTHKNWKFMKMSK